jgi:hypothetical protein
LFLAENGENGEFIGKPINFRADYSLGFIFLKAQPIFLCFPRFLREKLLIENKNESDYQTK